MKVRTSLFSLLLASQVLPWTVQSVHAQTYDAQAAQREDDFDARQLQNEYRTAYTYVFKMPAYSVDEVTETSKTLGDGNQVSSRQSLTRYRDRNGRVKIAYKTLDGKERTLIADPIARTGYLVRPNRQDILRVTGEPPAYRFDTAPKYARMYDFSKRTETALGVKDVGGVKAIGTLIETVYPAGTRGSEKEMVETRETWRSDELAATVYMRTVSPRYGERIVRYENLKFADLPESAFALPSGYPIRNIVLDTRQAAE